MIQHVSTWFNVKLFADDTSLFSIVDNMNMSTINLKNDLKKPETGQFSGKWILTLILVLFTNSESSIFTKASKDKT